MPDAHGLLRVWEKTLETHLEPLSLGSSPQQVPAPLARDNATGTPMVQGVKLGLKLMHLLMMMMIFDVHYYFYVLCICDKEKNLYKW